MKPCVALFVTLAFTSKVQGEAIRDIDPKTSTSALVSDVREDQEYPSSLRGAFPPSLFGADAEAESEDGWRGMCWNHCDCKKEGERCKLTGGKCCDGLNCGAWGFGKKPYCEANCVGAMASCADSSSSASNDQGLLPCCNGYHCRLGKCSPL